MEEIKVKNEGHPVFVGRVLCERGRVTPVIKQDYIDFCKNPAGASLNGKSIFIIDGDIENQQRTEQEALRTQIETEIRAEVEDKINGLQDVLKEKNNKIISLESQIAELEKKSKAGPADVDPKDFVFDPDAHTIEHRGGGKYFVMDAEDNKLYGPLTEEEKASFSEMQKEG